MALTATPQSALPSLSWDEEIVPALRKRLESESRALSKRMSTVSIPSGDEGYSNYQQSNLSRPPLSKTGSSSSSNTSKQTGGRVTPSTLDRERPSAIPRPSLNYSRPAIDRPNGSTRSNKQADSKKEAVRQRSRTFSQPYQFDPASVSSTNGRGTSTTRNTNVLPTPASSRSNSPAVSLGRPLEAKPTRIPKVAKQASATGTIKAGDLHVDDWNVYQQSHNTSSRSSLSVPRQAKTQNVGIMSEQPPFTANSINSSMIDDGIPRRSAEEELPFEHWYRGDVSRNGGVGELRVANRLEMLEIANYGHKLRQRSPGGKGHRRRAESIGNRESVILDDYDPRDGGEMVLDEAPLTDMEADTETEHETSFAEYYMHDAEDEDVTLTHVASDSTAVATPRQQSVSQIPQPTGGKLSYSRAASEPLETVPAGSKDRSRPNGVAQSQSQSLNVSQKRSRTKSPTPSANKKPKNPVQQKRSKSALDVRQTSEYPDPPEMPGGMADAIPSWTQPKPRTGNWDDVVLPVVARKMGLEDQYEEASGSPAPKQQEEQVAPPAPGTFGFDPTKRRRFDSTTGEAIPMDEFGNLPLDQQQRSDRTQRHKPRPISTEPLSPTSMSRHRDSPPPSPAPFAHYAAKEEDSHRPEAFEVQRYEEPQDASCCKCIIM